MLSGWTPTEVHRTERDPDGATRVVVTRDSPWDDDQVALLVAAAELENAVGPHGQPMDEALSPLADRGRRLPGGWHYVAHRRIDHAQAAIDAARADLARRYPDADYGADIWTVEKTWND